MRSLLRPRVLLPAIGLAVLVALVLRPETVGVSTATVSRAPLVVTINEDGRTRVRDRFVITAPVAGQLRRLTLEPGDRVERGRTVVAVIEPAAPAPLDVRTRAELEAAVGAAEASLGRLIEEERRAKSMLDVVRQQLSRSQTLAAAGAVSEEALEVQRAEAAQADAAARAAEFSVAQARQEVAAGRARLGEGAARPAGGTQAILAPVDGVVLVRRGESQRVVAPGEPLLEVGDPAAIEIVADLLSADAVRVTPGARVLIDNWGGDKPLAGSVRRVEPSGFTKVSALGVEEQRVNVVIDFVEPAAAAALGDGYRVDVGIVVWEHEDVLQVPVATLFRDGGRWAVFAVVDGAAVVREVTLGQRSAEAAEVLGGVEEGMTLVAYPPDTLAGDTRVNIE
jgi:HlyD family secretion protein